jgi:phage/plasmid-like protein (TIGR03299 family)
MSANVGEVFYTGETPWHGLGVSLAKPVTLDDALKVGGLKWAVGEVDLLTADDPPSPVLKRKAIVRLDRPMGHPGRVLGVAHRGFVPIQNQDAGLLFDAIFGQGKSIYHTGGYLGDGEVIWLLAKINKTLRIGTDDLVEPYALMANSHDGSMAFNIRLTTIRVVCQNTLAIAMQQKVGRGFRRAHHGSFLDHAEAAQDFFAATLQEFDLVGASFIQLSQRRCLDEKFKEIVATLMPAPKKPKNAASNHGLLRAWEKRVSDVRAARAKISELRTAGKGTEMASSKGTLWGALNAVLEYVDHYHEATNGPVSYALLGDGMELKARAFKEFQEAAMAA